MVPEIGPDPSVGNPENLPKEPRKPGQPPRSRPPKRTSWWGVLPRPYSSVARTPWIPCAGSAPSRTTHVVAQPASAAASSSSTLSE